MNRGEWQAVVLCGGMGSRMTELTDRIPKCMLPIAGVAMFWYPLNFLRKNNIKGWYNLWQGSRLLVLYVVDIAKIEEQW